MTNKFAPIVALTDTDAYKLGHRDQYPPGTTGVLSNYTNRKSRIERIDHAVHFGLQYFLEDWMINAWRPFFEAGEDEVCALYEEFVTSVIGPNNIGSDHVRALHKLGYLPLVFCSLPEGTLVPFRVPSFTIENTLPDFFWLVNYIETVLSSTIWQPSTSATTAYYFRKLLNEWAIKTTGSTDGVQWLGHDFSFRGMAGREAAAASGAGHILSFTGSDNLNVINFINDYYDGENGLILGSVPATEHSVMCAGGSDEGDEQATYERLLTLYPEGIVSVVSDTWDLWNVLTVILPNLKDQIMVRDGKLVIRPDSGDPVAILTGNQFDDGWNTDFEQGIYEREHNGYPDDRTPAQKGVVELLWDVFGGTVNEQGYKVLDSHIGSIYGDSITWERADEICKRLAKLGFASTNVVFGIGSYTYQYVTRDTFSSAIKATWVEIDGVGKDIFKNPVTDSGMKKSAKGRLAVVKGVSGELELAEGILAKFADQRGENLLKPVWKDGVALEHQSLADIRAVLHPEGMGA
jgi:nicotinamide phosphoribosyltransferase